MNTIYWLPALDRNVCVTATPHILSLSLNTSKQNPFPIIILTQIYPPSFVIPNLFYSIHMHTLTKKKLIDIYLPSPCVHGRNIFRVILTTTRVFLFCFIYRQYDMNEWTNENRERGNYILSVGSIVFFS